MILVFATVPLLGAMHRTSQPIIDNVVIPGFGGTIEDKVQKYHVIKSRAYRYARARPTASTYGCSGCESVIALLRASVIVKVPPLVTVERRYFRLLATLLFASRSASFSACKITLRWCIISAPLMIF